MRAEAAGARTWLIGAVALWALATWVLGLFGLGGRIERLPPDPSLVQTLPAATPGVEDRLGPLAQYSEFGERPLFTTDRRPEAFVINPAADENAPAEFEYVLTSVLLTPGLEVAIVQPADGGESVRLKVGESASGAPGWQLVSVSPRSAVFDGPGGQRTLELRVFDGVGGEPPTAMAAPVPTAARPGQPQPAQRTAPGRARGTDANAAAPVRQPAAPPTAPPEPVDASSPEQAPPPGSEAAAARTSEEQVEAIRARIEARRARLREQAQQGAPQEQDQ